MVTRLLGSGKSSVCNHHPTERFASCFNPNPGISLAAIDKIGGDSEKITSCRIPPES